MPTYTDPGCFCKFFCPPCAVYQSQGCKCPEIWFAWGAGCCYTMLCWDPTTPIQNVTFSNTTVKDEPAAGAPGSVEIVR